MSEVKNEVMVNESNGSEVIQDEKGNFKRVVKYAENNISMPVEDEVKLFNVVNGNDDSVVQLSRIAGETIRVQGFMTSPYESVDEKTGELTNGVSTIIYDGASYFATSSKTVYWDLVKLTKTFGMPSPTMQFEVKVKSTKMVNGNQISLELVKINR